jgi:chromosomal replication initiator protein
MEGVRKSVEEKLNEIYRHLESPALREVLEQVTLEEFDDKVIVRVPDEYCKFAFLKEIYPDLKRELDISVIVLTPSEDVIFELSPKYTFKNFVVGKGNLLAVRACQLAVENLKRKSIPYNPIFIYGRVGVGKTHLLQATGNLAVKKGFKVVYRSAIDFAEEVVNAIKEGSISYLRDFYRNVDVLLIDDVQFMAGKERTQLEFFNIFNYLYQNNRLIVIASDREPKKLKDVMDRLVSRFAGGLVTELKIDSIIKKGIIKEKLIIYGLPVDEDIIDYIAQNTGDNVREIEGFIAKLKAENQFSTKPLKAEKKEISPREVINEVLNFYGISKKDLLNKRRSRKFALYRQITMYLLRELCKLPLTKIGEIMGIKDHTTVIYALRKIEKLKQENDKLRKEIEFLLEHLRGEF